MKLLLLVLALAMAIAAPALADEPGFIPLQDYVAQPGVADDPVAMTYLANRCSAFYAIVSKNLQGETDPARQQARVQADTAAEKFMTFAAKATMTGTTMEFPSALARIQSMVIVLGNIYHDRIEHARALTGDMFSDRLIMGDLVVCKTLLAKLS